MEQIGRFKILGELGRGAMGVVYKAEDPALGRIVALKSILLRDVTDESERSHMRDRLFREARSAGMLSHPGIVTVFDTFEQDGNAYIFMEWVNGPTLEALLASGKLDGETFLNLLRQTAAALDYAHAQGIVHRDIKPVNIMVNEAGQAKIADFGVARIMSQKLTQSGSVLGTPSYMSPEQIQGLPVDGRADQLALAVVAYEALTGEKPFAGDTIATLLFRITKEEAPAASRLNASLTPAIDAVLRQGMAKRPQERFPTCAAFVEALTSACAHAPGWTLLPPGEHASLPTIAHEVRPAPLPEWKREPQSKSFAKYYIAFGILGVVMVAGAAYWSLREPVTDPMVSVPAMETPVEPAKQPATPETTEQPIAPVAATEPPPPAPGTIHLTTKPAGARVIFDSDPALACNAPCSMSLSGGRHAMNVARAGYRDQVRNFDVAGDAEFNVDLDLITGVLTLNTTPSGLTVLVDGQEQSGKTPLSITLPVGEHRVQVINGAERQDFPVQIRDGGITSKTVEWQ